MPIGGPTFPDNTFPDRISVDLGSVLDWFGTGLGSVWDRFGVVLGSVWGSLSNGFRGFCGLGNDMVRKGVVRKGGPSDGLHEDWLFNPSIHVQSLSNLQSRRRSAWIPATNCKGWWT